MGGNKKYSILVTFLLMLLILSTPQATATSAEVKIELDRSKMTYEYDVNSSNIFTVHGIISCEIDGLGQNIHDIEVWLKSDDTDHWGITIAPNSMLFEENGKKSFNLSISVPDRVENRTENNIIIKGYWETHPGLKGQASSQGEAESVKLVVKIIRDSSPFPPTWSIEGDLDEPRDLEDAMGWPLVVTLIGIPIIIGVIIIIYYFYKKKKEFELLK
jgi:hypothetical protein